MRDVLRFAATLSLIAFLPDSVTAQDALPYNQRIQWTAPPAALDSSTIRMRTVDVGTGESVPALVCFRSGEEVVTDLSGEVQVSGLRQTNTPVVVMAAEYEQVSLIFFPGKRGRSYATIRLVPKVNNTTAPTCRDAVWPF